MRQFSCGVFYSNWEDQGVKHANVEKLKLSEPLSVNKLMNDSLTTLKTSVVLKRLQPAGGSSGSAEKEQKVPGPLRMKVWTLSASHLRTALTFVLIFSCWCF